MQTVVAAILRDGAHVLIAQRITSGPHSLKWEFPGGKVEPGETAEQALRRELREELAIEATIGPEYTRYQYSYPGKQSILLIFFEIAAYSGTPQNQGAFETITWEPVGNFSRYDFLEGDLALIQLLSKIEVNQV